MRKFMAKRNGNLEVQSIELSREFVFHDNQTNPELNMQHNGWFVIEGICVTCFVSALKLLVRSLGAKSAGINAQTHFVQVMEFESQALGQYFLKEFAQSTVCISGMFVFAMC